MTTKKPSRQSIAAIKRWEARRLLAALTAPPAPTLTPAPITRSQSDRDALIEVALITADALRSYASTLRALADVASADAARIAGAPTP